MDLIVASNNKGKIEEIKKIFSDFNILSQSEAGIYIDVIEDSDTFYGNACKKAIEIYEKVKKPVIADDSGLTIEYFEDWPGVFTHRFLGDNADDKSRNEYILNKMKDIKNEEYRKAKFKCVIVYYDGKNIISKEGCLNGTIAKKRLGNNGFGFDEIFMIDNNLTLAQISSEEKNKISARKQALNELKLELRKDIVK